MAGAGARSPTSNLGATKPRTRRRLRVGIINVMPRAESYEPYLLRPLSDSDDSQVPVDVAWIRLESHTYSSSDHAHIAATYHSYGDTIAAAPLDGLILTGAPVEDLPYDQVTYWPELTRILTHARQTARSTLGVCWGGMALAKIVGIDKQRFPRKLFGVFENRALAATNGLFGAAADDRFWCAHSRHSGIADDELERARDAGEVRLLSHARETGYSIFETPDHRFVMHLGHPEYEASRLVEEWRRDFSLGRADVDPPVNFDVEAPINTWRSHRARLFSAWLDVLDAAVDRPRAAVDTANTANIDRR